MVENWIKMWYSQIYFLVNPKIIVLFSVYSHKLYDYTNPTDSNRSDILYDLTTAQCISK